MLKSIFQNKLMQTDDMGELRLDVAGVPVNRAAIEKTREEILEKVARERDPVARGELALQLSKLNELIYGFDAVERAKQQCEVKRLELAVKELEAAAIAKETFEGNCRLIASCAVDRVKMSDGRKLSYGFDENYWSQGSSFNLTGRSYFQKIMRDLSYDLAQAQADEILTADLERRDWQWLRGMPKPELVRATGKTAA